MRLACAMLALLLAMPAAAQPDLSRRVGTTVADTGVPGWRFEQFRVASIDGQRQYRVRVALPAATASTRRAPVAYLLDGNAALMEMDSALLARLARAPRPPVIAFIAHDNDLRIDADNRAYDYTPRRPGSDEAQRDPVGGRRNGGADAFLDLIEAVIAPRVEAIAHVEPTERALWGHSYGGVFVLHALFVRPGSFDVYAAADPSLWWGGGYLLEEEAASKQVAPPAPRVRLWVGEGGRDDARMPPPGRDPAQAEAMRASRASVPADATAQMAARLRERGLPVDFSTLSGHSHGETLGATLPLFLAGLSGEVPVTESGR